MPAVLAPILGLGLELELGLRLRLGVSNSMQLELLVRQTAHVSGSQPRLLLKCPEEADLRLHQHKHRVSAQVLPRLSGL